MKNKVTASRHFQSFHKIINKGESYHSNTQSRPSSLASTCLQLSRSAEEQRWREFEGSFWTFFKRGKKKKRKEERSLMDCDSPLNSRNSPVTRRFLKSRCLEKWWLFAWWRCCSTAVFCSGFSLWWKTSSLCKPVGALSLSRSNI